MTKQYKNSKIQKKKMHIEVCLYHKDEGLPDGVNLAVASVHDSNVQEEGSVISDRIEIHNMQIEAPNHTEGISMVTGSSSGEVSSEVVASNENKVQD